MNDSAMLSQIKTYLSEKFSDSEQLPAIEIALANNIPHFNKAISIYNRERKSDFESDFPWLWCVNAQESNALMQKPLPTMTEIFELLKTDERLSTKVFEHLRDNPYFSEVWHLPTTSLADNLLLLIYRTAILFSNEAKYFNKFTKKPAIQLSSTIEEMIYCQKITTGESPLYDSFKHWLENWKEEEFAEELYKACFNR